MFPELDVVLATGETATVAVEPWSAESPRLYRGTLATETESVTLAIGFRRVTIDDGRLLVNGVPVFFRGVNRHEQDWERGRSLDRDTMLRDILEMKRHNINAVRTSHYPPHPDFLRLCDEIGLWVVEECDLETHGFIYAGWEGNPPTEPQWLPAMLDRIQRMVERDKNRPSVVIWSMANESWTGANFDALEAWIRDRDPSRPILYERDPSYRNSDFYSVMYPDLERLEAIGRREEERPDGVSDEEDARRRTLPFLLCEYAHAMGNGPGSLHDYHRIMRSHPRICGGFVWEWIDHGFRHVDGAGNEFVMHGGDVAYRPNGGRYCLDGLLFADRTPGPGLAELAAVLQPVEIGAADDGVLIRNAQDFVDTSSLRFEWLLEHDGVRVGGGDLAVPVLAPGEAATLPLPAHPGTAPGDWWLTVRGLQREDTAWAPAGHLVARGQWALARTAPAPAAGSPVAPRQGDGVVFLGPGEFDAGSGALIRLGGVPVDGPRLDLYRAATENDRGQGDRNNLAAVWQAVGLDRLQHRTDGVRLQDDGLEVVVRTSSSTHPHAADTVLRWSCVDDVLQLSVTVDFVGPWRDTPYMHRDIVVPRLGLRLGLPGGYGRAEWFGLGPQENYVDSTAAAVVGRHASTIDDLQVDYPTPQENGNRMGTRWLTLAGDGLPTLRFLGPDEFAFTARRWTSEALERARHPQDLVDSGRVWLNLDHAQQGIGSASVGPALPERYRVPLTRASWTVTFAVD